MVVKQRAVNTRWLPKRTATIGDYQTNRTANISNRRYGGYNTINAFAVDAGGLQLHALLHELQKEPLHLVVRRRLEGWHEQLHEVQQIVHHSLRVGHGDRLDDVVHEVQHHRSGQRRLLRLVGLHHVRQVPTPHPRTAASPVFHHLHHEQRGLAADRLDRSVHLLLRLTPLPQPHVVHQTGQHHHDLQHALAVRLVRPQRLQQLHQEQHRLLRELRDVLLLQRLPLIAPARPHISNPRHAVLPIEPPERRLGALRSAHAQQHRPHLLAAEPHAVARGAHLQHAQQAPLLLLRRGGLGLAHQQPYKQTRGDLQEATARELHGGEVGEEKGAQQSAERRVAEGALCVGREAVELAEERDGVGEVAVEQALEVGQQRVEGGGLGVQTEQQLAVRRWGQANDGCGVRFVGLLQHALLQVLKNRGDVRIGTCSLHAGNVVEHDAVLFRRGELQVGNERLDAGKAILVGWGGGDLLEDGIDVQNQRRQRARREVHVLHVAELSSTIHELGGNEEIQQSVVPGGVQPIAQIAIAQDEQENGLPHRARAQLDEPFRRTLHRHHEFICFGRKDRLRELMRHALSLRPQFCRFRLRWFC